MSPPAEPLSSEDIYLFTGRRINLFFEGATQNSVIVDKSRYTDLILRTDQRSNIAVYCHLSNSKFNLFLWQLTNLTHKKYNLLK